MTVTVFVSVALVPELVQVMVYCVEAAGESETLPEAPPAPTIEAPFRTVQAVAPAPPVQFQESLVEAGGGIKRAEGEAEKAQEKAEMQAEPMPPPH